MQIERQLTRAHGWEGTLKRHSRDRNNVNLSPSVRLAADKAYKKIVAQLNDKHLMSQRERLIRASQAGDARAIDRISKQMRDYLKQDLETGL
jgi:hypothetical protein